MVEFQDVICHAQDGPFGVYLDVPPEKKPSKIHVFFCHSKRPFRLYAAVDPKQFSKGSIDQDFHSLPLLHKLFGDVQGFIAFFQWCLAPAFDALLFPWAALAFGAFVYGRLYGKTY